MESRCFLTYWVGALLIRRFVKDVLTGVNSFFVSFIFSFTLLLSSEHARARARANHANNDAQEGCAMQLNGITFQTVAENCRSVISCIIHTCRYSREAPFIALNVDIRNHHSLLDSMEQFVKGDLLEGANAYHCEKCDKKVSLFRPP